MEEIKVFNAWQCLIVDEAPVQDDGVLARVATGLCTSVWPAHRNVTLEQLWRADSRRDPLQPPTTLFEFRTPLVTC